MIENPMESSQPPPPPPPPPLPPPLPSPLPPPPPPSCAATTTVMTITIAESPTATTPYPPVPATPLRFSYRETYGPPFAPTVARPARRASHPRGRSPYDGDHPDGASPPTARRIDKSGLLVERGGLGPARFETGGILSPRRFECVGQLDPVPEAGNDGSSARGSVPGTEQERGDHRVDPACRETPLSVVDGTTRSPIADESISFERGNVVVVGAQPLKSFEREFRRVEPSSSKDVPGRAAFHQSQKENCEARARTLERLSRLVQQGRSDRRPPPRYSETRCDFDPYEARGGTAYSNFEGSVPSNRAIASTVTTSTTTVAVSALGGTNAREEDAKGSKERAPEEERAEAEGCEHGSTRNPLKNGESSNRADEFADNDGIQTLRVIILSEQL